MRPGPSLWEVTMHLAGTILPIFAIILTGWFAGASGYMPRALAAPLMRFAYYVAMPPWSS